MEEGVCASNVIIVAEPQFRAPSRNSRLRTLIMASQVCKNGVLDVFRAIYSFQFRIKMNGLNEFKII